MKQNLLRSREEFEAVVKSIRAEAVGMSELGEPWELNSSLIKYTTDDGKPVTEINFQLKTDTAVRGVSALITETEKIQGK